MTISKFPSILLLIVGLVDAGLWFEKSTPLSSLPYDAVRVGFDKQNNPVFVGR